MAEYRLFDPASPPACADPAWYADRDRAPHLEEDVHKARLHTARDLVASAKAQWAIQTVCDLGCGDGGLLQLLEPLGLSTWGYDLQPANVDAALNERHVDARLGDFVNTDLPLAELCVCTEVLEHLVDPHGFLEKLDCSFLVASSPMNEDDKYHYEHHLWAFDMDGYAQLMEDNGWHVVIHVPTPPFQVILASRKT